MSAEPLSISLNIEIHAHPEDVWAIVGSAEGMTRWLGMTGFQPNSGAEWEMYVTTDYGEFHFYGEVVKVEPPSEIAFTWIEHEKGKEPWPTSTLVSLQLTATKDGTRVTLLHSGFEALPEKLASTEWQGHKQGWESRKVLQVLKRLIEEGE
ncbi:MAG: SRPBCC domain-containing protein [Chloroflexi bacterium]|nr:SRPBCC domain-containing protein [Chloroflexota bacterium]